MRKKVFYTLLSVLFWLAVWQVSSIIINQPLYMPSPVQTASALFEVAATADFWLSVLFTFYRVAAGLLIAFVLGVALAFTASVIPFIEHLLSPFMAAVKSTPVMSVIMLALVWFSSSAVPVFSCVLLCLPVFYANTLGGLRSVDKQLLEVAYAFGVKRRHALAGITVPSILPNIYTALSICLGFSWKSVVAAEVLSTPRHSLGYNLYATKLYLNTPELFAWTLTIIIISLAVEKGLKRVLPKGDKL